jgi:hypothetical protein
MPGYKNHDFRIKNDGRRPATAGKRSAVAERIRGIRIQELGIGNLEFVDFDALIWNPQNLITSA